MRTLAEMERRMKLYEGAEYLYFPGFGNIAWHYSTGDNIEILFVEAVFGYGAVMLARMVKLLEERNESPYHSVFAFRLKSNIVAEHFYERLGWHQIDLGQSIYRGDGTVLMWITWTELVGVLKKYSIYDR